MRERVRRMMDRYYPDGFRNGTAAFYNWVRDFSSPETVMLNLGAGPTTGQPIRVFKGEVAKVIGADIDPAVLGNTELDASYVYPATGPLPFTAEYFDLVLSDFVLEHVEQPEPFLREVNRVLKPGCSFFFRTPNRNHYIAMAARATPHWFHEMVANRARSMSAEAHEPWPAYYRLNSRTQIRRAAIASGFTDIEFRMYEAEPSYLVFHEAAFAIGTAYERLVNRFDFLSGIRANIFGRLKK